MSGYQRPVVRALIAAPAAAALYLGALAGIAPARAHVHVEAADAVGGQTAVLTFKVPNESETGALTTALTVELPEVAAASTETAPGWAAELDRDTAAGTVHSVTWTAAPGGGIGADQFALFRISVALPDTETVSFPATQKYSDGAVVHWDQRPRADGEEPEYPAPALTLATGASADDTAGSQHASTDTTARLLAGAGLLAGAAGLAAAVLRRRP